MSDNNYAIPNDFTQPPPNYNLNNSWNYNWLPHFGQNITDAQDNTLSIAPQLLSGLPPPSINSRAPSLAEVVEKLERLSKANYNNSSSTQGIYQARGYNTISGPYNNLSSQFTSSPGQYNFTQNQCLSTPGQFASNPPGMFNRSAPPGYSKNYYGKRKTIFETKKSKKKKRYKDLPPTVTWSVTDAKKAWKVENDGKKGKRHSLIIKFPDLELNKNIVSNFHSAIDNVHFQQPSTPRFCFVTLKESAKPEAVIKDLNKIPFDQGYLTAASKNEKEEINLEPKDIDPLTLYVGNLSQEVIKDDIYKLYPKRKKIDIGYAKKMKYTRYAIVSFNNVDDSIEAFQKTHNTQLHSKTLIVRFRRLDKKVPDEPQSPERIEVGEDDDISCIDLSSNHSNNDDSDVENHNQSSDVQTKSDTVTTLVPREMVEVSQIETNTDKSIDLSFVNQEPLEDSNYEKEDREPPFSSAFIPEGLDSAFSRHRPNTNSEIMNEQYCKRLSLSSSIDEEVIDLTVADKTNKTKPVSHAETNSDNITEIIINKNENISYMIIPPDKIKDEIDTILNENLHQALTSLHPQPLIKDSTAVEVKKGPSEAEEINDESPRNPDYASSHDKGAPSESVEVPVGIKSELNDKEEENDAGDEDEDDSSDGTDDFRNKLSQAQRIFFGI